MTDAKRYNVRGMNIDEIVTVAGKAIDEIVEESQTNFIIDIQDDGYTAEDAEAVFESQRASMAAWRKKTLADVRSFLERDCENLR
jgi:hypothetical protein